jgi:hypothetical protein
MGFEHQQPLRVLLFQDLPGRWSARSLEHDLAVEGRSLDAVLDRILQLIFAHIDFDRRHGRAPLSAFPAAPRRFWDAFNRARPLRSVNRRSSNPACSDGPILISISENRSPIDYPARVVTDNGQQTSDGRRVDPAPAAPTSDSPLSVLGSDPAR